MSHPPERGPRRPIAAAATCGATCCTSTCSSAHSIGGLIGAFVGASRALAKEQSEEDKRATESAVSLYVGVFAVLSFAALMSVGWFALFIGLPVVQLAASLIAVAIAALALRPRQTAINTIRLITGPMFAYALIGGLITFVGLGLFFK